MTCLEELSGDPEELHSLVDEVHNEYARLRVKYEQLFERHRALQRHSIRLERSLEAVCSMRGLRPP